MEPKYKKLSTKNLFTSLSMRKSPENKSKFSRIKKIENAKKNKPGSNTETFITVNTNEINNKTFHKKNNSTFSVKTLITKIKNQSNYMNTNNLCQSSLNIFQNSIPDDKRLKQNNNFFYSNINNYQSTSFQNIKDLKSSSILNSNKNNSKKYISPNNENIRNNTNKSENNKNEKKKNEIINLTKRVKNGNIFDNEIKIEKHYQDNTFVYRKAKLSKILSPKVSKIFTNSNNHNNRCCINKIILRNKNTVNNIISPINYKKINYNYGTVNGHVLKNYEKFNTKKIKRINYSNRDDNTVFCNNSYNDLVKEIIINNNNNKLNNKSFNYYYNNPDTNNGNDETNKKNNYFQKVIKNYLIENNNKTNNKQITKSENQNDIFKNAFLVQKRILTIQKNYRMHLSKIKYNIIKTFTKFVNGINIINKLFLKKYLNELFINVIINTNRLSLRKQKQINEIEINLKDNKNSRHKKANSNCQFNKYQKKLIIKRKNNDQQRLEIETLSDSKNTLTETNTNKINEIDEIIKENYDTYNENKDKKMNNYNLFIQKNKFNNKYYQIPNLDNILSIRNSNIFYQIYNKDNSHSVKKTNNINKKFITYKKI